MIEAIKEELSRIEEALFYMEEDDESFYPEYPKLLKKRRILIRTVRKLERLEGRK